LIHLLAEVEEGRANETARPQTRNRIRISPPTTRTAPPTHVRRGQRAKARVRGNLL